MVLDPQNAVLRAALRAKRPQLARKLKRVTFTEGEPFWLAGEPIPYLLFPLWGIVSIQLAPERSKRVEVALVGREGFAGVPVLLGAPLSNASVYALTPGEGVVMPPEIFTAYLGSAIFRHAAERYARSLLAMLARISACNRAHVIEKLCVGRLLMMQDRTGSDSFNVTQDYLSRVLGVRRASVSRAAAGLQKLGAITYDRHGRLTIADRNRLEKLACSCYRAIKADFDELLVDLNGE